MCVRVRNVNSYPKVEAASEKNESEQIYRKGDKIEERSVIRINKEIDGTSSLTFSRRKFLKDASIFSLFPNVASPHY